MNATAIVQCRKGHLFRTVWVPLVSFKAVRLGRLRFQYCPVGKHWTLVAPVDPAQLTEEQRRLANERLDSALP